MMGTVVGITRDTDVGTIGARRDGIVFVPFTQRMGPEMTVAARTSGDVTGSAAGLSVLARELDADIVTRAFTGVDVMAAEVAPTRIGMLTVGGLGTLAFMLASVGLYGVMSHIVAMRTREIGIRMALGAEAQRVVRLLLREGAALVFAGGVAGALLAYWIVRLLKSSLFGLNAQEPLVVAAVAILLGGVALVACLIPARRAARVDPNVVLKLI
jgi:putative ABC transport system permease protein